jgi:hypothetical protein
MSESTGCFGMIFRQKRGGRGKTLFPHPVLKFKPDNLPLNQRTCFRFCDPGKTVCQGTRLLLSYVALPTLSVLMP